MAMEKGPTYYDYSDKLDASRTHPGSDSIPLKNVPMFICFGFDDNGNADKKKGRLITWIHNYLKDKENKGGITWIRNYLKDKENPAGTGQKTTYDATPIRASFYMTEKYARKRAYSNYSDVRKAWRSLYEDGYEIGNHSTNHLMGWDDFKQVIIEYNGGKYTREQWLKELVPCYKRLTDRYDKESEDGGIGIPAASIWGWRTPKLEWNDAILGLLKEQGYIYDCSIDCRWSDDNENDGTSFYWPYTLDSGSPHSKEVSNHKGLWEMPVYPFVIPKHLQEKEKAGGEIMTGFDYNVWIKKEQGGMGLTAPDFTDILKYTLDQRMKGNRAPFLIGLHSDIYSSQKDSAFSSTQNARARQLAIENFIEYAITQYPHEVRFVTARDIIRWMRNPVGLGDTKVSQ
jgi:peptidoglycan/xylan/chitin deacetylase (PgdA/CDA1 family)